MKYNWKFLEKSVSLSRVYSLLYNRYCEYSDFACTRRISSTFSKYIQYVQSIDKSICFRNISIQELFALIFSSKIIKIIFGLTSVSENLFIILI